MEVGGKVYKKQTLKAIRKSYDKRSRQQSRWMWSAPHHTNTSKLHLLVEQFSQNTYWRLAEDIIQWKLQEKSPHNWIGEKKRGKKGIGMRSTPLVGSCETGKLPTPWGPPSPARRSAGMDSFKNSQSAKSGLQLYSINTDHHRWSLLCHCTAQTEMHSNWGLTLWFQWADPVNGLGMAVQRQPEGPGVWPWE